MADDEEEPFYSAYGKISSRFGDDGAKLMEEVIDFLSCPWHQLSADACIFFSCLRNTAHRGRHWTRRADIGVVQGEDGADRCPFGQTLRRALHRATAGHLDQGQADRSRTL